MSSARTKNCQQSGSRMHLRRTLIQRRMDGYDRTIVTWDCDCGAMFTESELDPRYRGIPLRRKAVRPYDPPLRPHRPPGHDQGALVARRGPRPSFPAGTEVLLPPDEDGYRLVRALIG